MDHLTQEQIFAFLDSQLDDALEHRFNAHLAECARCRNEVALQRSLARTVSELPLEETSTRFTGRVMSRVLQSQKRSFSEKILQNLGYAFAMMMVLGVLGYLLSNSSSLFSGSGESQPSEFVTAWKTFSANASQFLTQSTSQMSNTVTQQTATPLAKILTITFLVLIGLVAIDRFVLQKVVRMKL